MAINTEELLIQIKADVSDLKTKMGQASDSVKKVGRDGDQAGKSLTGSFSKARVAAIALAAPAVLGAVVIGIGRATVSALAAADAVGKFASALGLTAEQFQSLQFAMASSGISQSQFQMGMNTLNRSVGEAVRGNEAAIKRFEELGLSMDKIRGQDLEATLYDVVDALGDVSNANELAARSAELFGAKNAGMIVVAKAGADALKAKQREARALGAVMSNELVARAEEVNDKFSQMTSALGTNMRTALIQNFSRPVEIAAGWMERLNKGLASFLERTRDVALLDTEGIEERIKILKSDIEGLQPQFDRMMANPQVWGGDFDLGNHPFIQRMYGLQDELRKAESELAVRMAAFADEEATTRVEAEASALNERMALIRKSYAEEEEALRVKARTELAALEESVTLGKRSRQEAADIAIAIEAELTRELRRLSEARQADFEEVNSEQLEFLKAWEAARERAHMKQMKALEWQIEEMYKVNDAQRALIQGEKDAAIERQKLAGEELEGWRDKQDAVRVLEREYRQLRTSMILAAATPEEMKQAELQFIKNRNQLLVESQTNLARMNELIRDSGMAFASSFEKAILDGERLSQVVQSLTQDLLKLALRAMVMEPLVGALTGAMGSIFTAGSQVVANTANQFAGVDASRIQWQSSQPVPPSIRPPGRAGGGHVNPSTMYEVGERGREMFVPPSVGKIVPNYAMSGNTPQNISVRIENKGAPVEAVSSSATMSPKGMVISIITDDMRKGGPISTGLSQMYGLRRQN